MRVAKILLSGTALILVLTTVQAAAEQQRLAHELVRLHVVANSDSESDQRLKLRVRDVLLEEYADELSAGSRAEALERAAALLPDMERMAESVAEGYGVSIKIDNEYFPTKKYDLFSLLAGKYDTLKVTIGEGAGGNWWCVMFPPLCLSVCETAEVSEYGLTPEDIKLMTSEEIPVQFRFKLLELISGLFP